MGGALIWQSHTPIRDKPLVCVRVRSVPFTNMYTHVDVHVCMHAHMHTHRHTHTGFLPVF